MAQNTIVLTFSGLKQICLEDIFTDVLKTLSEGELVTQQHKYFLANVLNREKICCKTSTNLTDLSLNLIEDIECTNPFHFEF